jgi:hypothetical protein
VVIRDDNLGSLHVFEHVNGNQFAAGVVAVGVIGFEGRAAGL